MRRAAADSPLAAVNLQVVGGALRGTVLTLRQLDQACRAAAKAGARAEVKAIADPASELEEGWAEVAGEVLELFRTPSTIGDDGARQTEYTRGDGPLRILGRVTGSVLVQGPDLAMGWVPEAAVREIDAGPAREAWKGVVRAAAGEAVEAANGDIASLLAGAREWLQVPYRWGGTTRHGVDCSGLVQRVFSREAGILLPKHTGDQRGAGRRVAQTEARPGDLLFATPIGQRVGHVLLVSTDASVIHACRSERRVIEESLASNRERYQHQGYRRPVLLREAR